MSAKKKNQKKDIPQNTEKQYPWAECANPYDCPKHCECWDQKPEGENGPPRDNSLFSTSIKITV